MPQRLKTILQPPISPIAAMPWGAMNTQPRTCSAHVSRAQTLSFMSRICRGRTRSNSSTFFEHEGGFAAATKYLGGKASLYHLDATRPDLPVARGLGEEFARAIRGRVANPKWLAGQMRHGYRGAAEIAEAVDNLYGFAVTSGTVTPRQFELVFDATLGNDERFAFLQRANPEAGRGVAQRFDQAMRRGLWACRRNSVAMRLASILESA